MVQSSESDHEVREFPKKGFRSPETVTQSTIPQGTQSTPIISQLPITKIRPKGIGTARIGQKYWESVSGIKVKSEPGLRVT
jgi:hypothetical protein